MINHFIKNIEIKNFKCFENFKAEGFGRVNLIGGKNNVGKTTFLEALYINLNTKEKNWFLNSLFQVVKKRDNFFIANSLASISKFVKILFRLNNTLSKKYKKDIKTEILTNIKCLKFNFEESFSGTKIFYYIDDVKYNESILFKDLKELIYDDKIFITDSSIQFLRPVGLSNLIIIEFYAIVQLEDKEEELNKRLKEFDRSINQFKIINNEPTVLFDDEYLAVTQLGDGVKKLINIFISIYSSTNGILIIDELDNGIHYSSLDLLWEIILKISKDQKVQVFATTHSKECIESYARVAKRLEDEDVTYSILSKLKSGKIHHSLYDKTLLETAFYQEHEVR